MQHAATLHEFVRKLASPLAVLGVSAALTLAATGAQAQVLARDAVIEHFKQFALVDVGPKDVPVVVKWEGPGVVLLDGKMSDGERKIVSDTVAEIARATRHDFHIFREGDHANIMVGFVDDFAAAVQGRYRDLFNRLFADPLRHIELLVNAAQDPKTICLYRPAVAGTSVIGGLVLVKPGLEERKTRKCVSVFLGKMIGLLGAAQQAVAASGSAMDEDDDHFAFNALDLEVMRLLYLAELAPGTDQRKALEIVEEHVR